MNSQAAQLNHILGNGAGVNSLLIYLRAPLVTLHLCITFASKPVPICQDVRTWLDRALLHEMRHHINPLAIPAQQPTPHLEALIYAYLALEATHHAAEHDEDAATLGPGLVQHQLLRTVVMKPSDTGLQQARDEMRARHVQIAEVRRVRLVEVVVAFGERGARGGDHGREDRRGRERGWDVRLAEEEVFED